MTMLYEGNPLAFDVSINMDVITIIHDSFDRESS
jgi:hypothetical protein